MIVLSKVEFSNHPFPHFTSSLAFTEAAEELVLEWLTKTDLWEYTKTSFYTQYEFSLLDETLPRDVQFLISEKTINLAMRQLHDIFSLNTLNLVGVTAHKLVNGYKMGVHNDFLGKEETHRLVVQFNSNWQEKHGGYLMLCGSEKPQDVSKIIKPLSNTAIGFEISEKSYHAVSAVYDFSRYTLVYTFNQN